MAAKPFMSYAEQHRQLSKKHGLSCYPSDVEKFMRQTSYYYLSGYRYHRIDKKTNKFRQGITLRRILNLYESDKQMRNVLFSYLERIELTAISSISYVLGERYGALGYMDARNFSESSFHDDFKEALQKAIDRANEMYIMHHQDKYDGNFPVWVALEMLSFSWISKVLKNMKNPDVDAVAVSMLQEKVPRVITTNLHCLTILRNRCAHHKRLFGYQFKLGCQFLNVHKAILFGDKPAQPVNGKSMFALVWTMATLLSHEHRARFLKDVEAVLAGNPDYELQRIGFPGNWVELMEFI